MMSEKKENKNTQNSVKRAKTKSVQKRKSVGKLNPKTNKSNTNKSNISIKRVMDSSKGTANKNLIIGIVFSIQTLAIIVLSTILIVLLCTGGISAPPGVTIRTNSSSQSSVHSDNQEDSEVESPQPLTGTPAEPEKLREDFEDAPLTPLQPIQPNSEN